MPAWFYGFLALCVALVALGLWMIVRTESYWRAAHWLVVRNVRTAEPHPFTLAWYRVTGVLVIVIAVWVAVTVSRLSLDTNRQADLEVLFGTRDVEVVSPRDRDKDIRVQTRLGPRYFEATPERRDALDGIDDAELLVEVTVGIEELYVYETEEQVTVTAWTSCDSAARYGCSDLGLTDVPDTTLWVVPISLAAPLGDRRVVDGATDEVLDRS